MLYILFDHINLCTETEVQRMLPLVSEQRREQALRFKHLHGQFCCLKSYLMLMELIGAVYPELDGKTPEFTYTEDGKPSIFGRPDIHFSISHTKNAILVALANHPIGADVEQIRHPSEGLIEKTMNEEEARQIAQADNPDAVFTALWTQKEAVLKLRGTGIVDDLHEVLDGQEKVVCEIRKGYAFSFAEFQSSSSLDL